MMHWMLALKRFLRPGTAIMLLLVLLTVSAGGAAGHETELRPCGVVCEDADPAAAAVQTALTDKGFVLYDTREGMEADISYGVLDCGAVLLPGLGQGIADGRPAGHILLLIAPDSFLTEAYEALLTAALYSAAAPVMTQQSAADAGVELSLDEIRAELEAMYAEGWLFSFDVTTVEGVPPVGQDMGLAIAQAAAGLLLFAAIFTGTLRAAADADRMRPRIGKRAAVTRILIPTLCWQTLFYLLAAGLTLPTRAALPGYVLLITALGLLAARLPMRLDALLPIILLGSLAVYPIYYDLAESYPWLAAVRYLLPPCWLLHTGEYPMASAMLGAVLTMLLAVLPQGRSAYLY